MCREVVNRGSECFANVTHPALLLLCRPREGGGREEGREGEREEKRKRMRAKRKRDKNEERETSL